MSMEPKIRVKGFSGEWKTHTIKDICEVNPKSALPNEFEYVDLESVLGTEMIFHRTEKRESAPSRAQRLAKKGDIFYQTVRPYQKNNYLFGIDETNYVFSTGYAQLRTKINQGYLFTLMQSPSFVNKVLLECTGTSYPAINPTNLSKIKIEIVDDEQIQQTIASYFQYLDSLIQSTTKKIESLKQVKAASLQSMFPQEGETTPRIRFKGFEGEWEKVEIKKIASFSKGHGYSKSDLQESGTPIILYGRMYTKYEVNISNVDTYVVPLPNSVYSFGDEVIMPASGETPEDISCASAIHEKGIILGGDLNVFRFNIKDYNTTFIALSLSSGKLKKELSNMAQGKSVVHLHNSDIEKVSILIPSYEEQTAIASYFTSLDTQITLQSQRLEKLKQIKSACLDNMFV